MNSLFTFHRYFGYIFSMRTLIIIPVLLFSLLLGVPSYSADFNKGLTAAQSGDFATALKEWKPLAEKGDVDAQTNLGLMYQNGWGVPQDDKEAVYWYKLAAEQEHAKAQYNLGVMYALGEGVIKDYVYAHMWGNIASMNGNDKGETLRGYVAEKMTSSQIEEAQRLARECIKKNYKGC